MKMFKYMAMAIVGSAMLFTACEPDPEIFEAPTVTITEGAGKVLAHADGPTFNMELNITIDAPGTIAKVEVVRTKFLGTTADEGTPALQDGVSGQTSATIKFTDAINYELFYSGEVDKIVYDVIVTDKQDEALITSATFEVTMAAYTSLTVAKEGEIWKLHNANEYACWNLKDDMAVSAITADEDAKRYLINTNSTTTVGATPTNFDGSWTSNEITWTRTSGASQLTKGCGIKYVKANGYDYANAPKEVALHLFNTAATADQKTDIANPAVDDIYIGKLNDELYVLKITVKDLEAVENTDAKENTGVLKFTYKK